MLKKFLSYFVISFFLTFQNHSRHVGFAPETLVLLANESFVEIKDLKVGDEVLSYDLKNDSICVNKVITLYRNARRTTSYILQKNDLKLVAGKDQAFLCLKGFCNAEEFAAENEFEITSKDEELLCLCSIELEHPHNFFITKEIYCVHNPVVETVGTGGFFLFSTAALPFIVPCVGAGLFGFAVFSYFNNNSREKKEQEYRKRLATRGGGKKRRRKNCRRKSPRKRA